MSNITTYTDTLHQFTLLNRMDEHKPIDPLYAFALDELLCKQVGQGGLPMCHLWRHPRSFIMGLRDSRLPGADRARQQLQALGYQVAVRNSGGAAVPLDVGVVNISLILPNPPVEQGPHHFHDDFELMYFLIRQALAHTGVIVDKGEIQGAFCPGDFDLSIGGRKFCGIAQRRQLHAYIVQAFVIVEGSGEARAALVRNFYEQAAEDADQQLYPLVVDSSTASLEQLIKYDEINTDTFAQSIARIIRGTRTTESCSEASSRLHLPTTAETEQMVQTLHSRYDIRP